MTETSWEECLENNTAIKVSADWERAKSLIETAKERTSLVTEITVKNCNFVFEDYYTSLLELLQALVILAGYKILNHICMGYYLKGVLKREDLFRIFDDLRYKRNSLTYYGKRMDFMVARDAIKKCRELSKEIMKYLNNVAPIG